MGYFIHFFCDEGDKSFFFMSGSNAVNGEKIGTGSETARGGRNLDGE